VTGAAATEPQNRPRVLLAGDAAARPEGLERALTRAGFRVSEGPCHEPGNPADAVLLTTRATVSEEISALLALCDDTAPRILLFSAADPELPGAALALGADDVLAPPVHLPELCARIHARIRDRKRPATPERGESGNGRRAQAEAQALERRLHEEFERARRYSLGFSLVLLAIEALDGTDDRIADELRRILRLPDFVGRYRESEFAIVLPETGSDGARRSIGRMRERLAALPPAMLSAGIVSYPHPAVTQPDDLFALVEAALARGKAVEGRVGVAE
jgi:PleD family two-component response regulator